jgi:ribulose-phosphate 3-epimerase
MRIHPSILSADFGRFADELESIRSADAAHVDVMDNHFVPNLTFGLPVVARLNELSPIPLDVHLMISDADQHAPKYAELGVDSVTFHLEACEDPLALARRLHQIGSKAAVAIKPATPVSELAELVTEVDMLLIMTVEPGFGGQQLIEQTLQKVGSARDLIRSRGVSVGLQVDGGVTESNIGKLAELGADVFVAGTAVFAGEDRAERISALRDEALSHSHQ